MDVKDFSIAEAKNTYLALDPKGRRTVHTDRKYACFIITVSGSIRFTADGKSHICDAEHPVFLPMGLSYVNECVESAKSYVFNFTTASAYDEIVSLAPVSESNASLCYRRIKALFPFSDLPERLQSLEVLYSLAAKLFEKWKSKSENPIAAEAVSYMRQRMCDPALCVGDVALHCHISEIYLRKIFERTFNKPPFKLLTDLRMDEARAMLEEKRPIKEVIGRVGYSDVYQFSRAYKRHFGFPPSKTE